MSSDEHHRLLASVVERARRHRLALPVVLASLSPVALDRLLPLLGPEPVLPVSPAGRQAAFRAFLQQADRARFERLLPAETSDDDEPDWHRVYLDDPWFWLAAAFLRPGLEEEVGASLKDRQPGDLLPGLLFNPACKVRARVAMAGELRRPPLCLFSLASSDAPGPFRIWLPAESWQPGTACDCLAARDPAECWVRLLACSPGRLDPVTALAIGPETPSLPLPEKVEAGLDPLTCLGNLLRRVMVRTGGGGTALFLPHTGGFRMMRYGQAGPTHVSCPHRPAPDQ